MKKEIFTVLLATALLCSTSCEKCTNCTLSGSGTTTYTYPEACGDDADATKETCLNAALAAGSGGTPTTCTCVED